MHSDVSGVPLAALGLVWTLVALYLFVFADMRKLSFVTNVWGIFGVVGIFYSVIAMFLLGNVCIYCSILDFIILLSVLLMYVNGKAQEGNSYK